MSSPVNIILTEANYQIKVVTPEFPSRKIIIPNEGGAKVINVEKVFANVSIPSSAGLIVSTPLEKVTVAYSFTSGGGVVQPTYAIRYDEIDEDTFYLGEAIPGSIEADPVWRIRKGIDSRTDISLLWAEGAAFFIHSWDDRLSLTYF